MESLECHTNNAKWQFVLNNQKKNNRIWNSFSRRYSYQWIFRNKTILSTWHCQDIIPGTQLKNLQNKIMQRAGHAIQHCSIETVHLWLVVLKISGSCQNSGILPSIPHQTNFDPRKPNPQSKMVSGQYINRLRLHLSGQNTIQGQIFKIGNLTIWLQIQNPWKKLW